MIPKNRWIGTAALCGCAALAAALSAPFESARRALWAGFGAALLLVLPGFWSLSWALDRSNKFFFSVFAAGSLWRLTGLAAEAFLAYRWARASLTAVLLSTVGGMIALSCVEMWFLQRQARLSHGLR